jgi:hypothetical protein
MRETPISSLVEGEQKLHREWISQIVDDDDAVVTIMKLKFCKRGSECEVVPHQPQTKASIYIISEEVFKFGV